jgi:hypothetical protein
MPYSLRKSPGHEAYWVVNSETGKKHSIKPLPYSRARAQMSALYAVENGYVLDRSKRRSRKTRKSTKRSRKVRGGQNVFEGGNIEGGKSKSKKK